MKELASAVFITVLLLLLTTPSAFADRPIYTGVPYPPGQWVGDITGRVTTSADQVHGLSGAYVALVNRYDESQEYANTTTDSQGDYYFAGVNGSFGKNEYEIYANISPYGEGYSAPFDIGGTGPTTTRVVIIVPTPTLTVTAMPTSMPVPSPTPAPTPTQVPAPTTTPMPTLTVTATPTPAPTLTVVSPPIMPPTPTQSTTAIPTMAISGTPVPEATRPEPSPAITIVPTLLIIGVVACCVKNRRKS